MAIDPIKQMYAARERELVKKIQSYKRPRANFVASELAACRLAIWYRLSGYIPMARRARGEDYGNDGNLHHDAVRNQMREAGIKIGDVKYNTDGTVEETGVFVLDVTHKGKKFKISMRLDGTVMLGTVKHTLEIKSLGYWKFKPLYDVWNHKDHPGSTAAVLGYIHQNRKDMIYQVHANMVATGCKKAYLVFKDRSDCALGLHNKKDPTDIIGGVIVTFNPTVWDNVLDKMSFIQKHLDSGKQPDPDFQIEGAECGYCNYHHLCHGAAKREKNGLVPAKLHPQLGDILHVDQMTPVSAPAAVLGKLKRKAKA